MSTVTLTWGRQWPLPPAPNVHPPPGPVKILRAEDYVVQVSTNGQDWRTVATVSGRTSGLIDTLHFKRTRARFIRVQITRATAGQPPMLQELSASR